MVEKRKADHNSLDLCGKNINYITVLERTEKRAGTVILWRCRCNACGRDDFLVRSYVLGAGKIKSCGCMTKQILKEKMTRHGLTDSRTWRTWKSMHARCYLKKHKSYKDYGGRGIFVCDRWNIFENFLEDMGIRPEGMTIGRINNNVGYFKENCRWETSKQQANNRRSSVYITYSGKTKTASQWCEELKISYDTLSSRLESGWSIKDAFEKPVKKQKNSRNLQNIFGEDCTVALYRLVE